VKGRLQALLRSARRSSSGTSRSRRAKGSQRHAPIDDVAVRIGECLEPLEAADVEVEVFLAKVRKPVSARQYIAIEFMPTTTSGKAHARTRATSRMK